MNYLIHHGIKGQKWGVRRFQNKDGSLTEDGRNRYRKSSFILPKDTTMVRYTPNKQEHLINKYASYTKYDINMYRDDAILEKLGFKNVKQIFAVDIVNTDPMVIRRGKKTVDDILSGNNDEALNSAYRYLDSLGYLDDKRSAIDRYNLIKGNNEAFEARKKLQKYIHDEIYKDRGAYAKKYSKKYDAVVDPEDFILNYESPLIFVKDNKLKIIKNEEISDDEKKRVRMENKKK